MAIGRPQMDEQITSFATGGVADEEMRRFTPGDVADEDPFSGEVDLSGIDPSALMMMTNYGRAVQDASKPFGARVKEYQEKLAPFAYQAPERDTFDLVFDLASTLGAGILSGQQQGSRNPYVGLGMGFRNFSQQLKKEQADNEKAQQQMGMQAAQLAMQSEQRAQDYLNELGIKMIDQANKKVDYIRIEYDETNEDGETETKYVNLPNTGAYRDQIAAVMAKPNAREIKLADTQINMPDPNKGKADLIALESIDASGKDYAAKANAAGAVIDQVNEAYLLANRVKEAGGTFGPMSDMLLRPRELVIELGFGDLLDAPGAVAPQKALRQLAMSFTMAIISQTKGAISNKEMQLFINASPTLGSTYDGFMAQLRLLEKLAGRDREFYDDYLDKKSELIEKGVRGQKMEVELQKFENSWRRENPFLTKEDEELLRREAQKSANEPDVFVPGDFKKVFDEKKRELAGYPTVNTQAEYDRLNKGDYYYENGVLFQK